MYEVEVKVRADRDVVRRRLEDGGATFEGSVRQVDTYFDAPHRDYADTDEALRIREQRGDDGTLTAVVTYKGPLVEAESKTREEFETTVGDPETAAAIFEGLGFTPAATVEKDRDFYALDGYTVTLDDVTGLGEFVEVETETTRQEEVEPAREKAISLLRDLGLDPDDQIRASYLGLLLSE